MHLKTLNEKNPEKYHLKSYDSNKILNNDKRRLPMTSKSVIGVSFFCERRLINNIIKVRMIG